MLVVLFPRRKMNMYLFLVCTLESGKALIGQGHLLTCITGFTWHGWKKKKRLDLRTDSHAICGYDSEELEIVVIHENR
jgi:hypothetical protein